MNPTRIIRCIAVAAWVLTAPAFAQTPLTDAPLRVYDATELPLGQYTVIKRLWVDAWRSAFHVPTDSDPGDAVRSLVEEAARLGADGVVNLHCVRGSDTIVSGSGYYCYGSAFKFRQGRG
jgi:hypothetical protein